MNEEIQALLDQNKAWAAAMEQEDPEFFKRLSNQQSPNYLWIGCSDSRVPANQITGLLPGEVFVHRNVANVVMQTDINCMSVVEFAISVIKVRYVIICGHYGCAGVKAAMGRDTDGVVDAWLSGIRDTWAKNSDSLSELSSDDAAAKLCELNVKEQVRSMSKTKVIRDAWTAGQQVDIHGWVYGVGDGLIRDLGLQVTSAEDAAKIGA